MVADAPFVFVLIFVVGSTVNGGFDPGATGFAGDVGLCDGFCAGRPGVACAELPAAEPGRPLTTELTALDWVTSDDFCTGVVENSFLMLSSGIGMGTGVGFEDG